MVRLWALSEAQTEGSLRGCPEGRLGRFSLSLSRLSPSPVNVGDTTFNTRRFTPPIEVGDTRFDTSRLRAKNEQLERF